MAKNRKHPRYQVEFSVDKHRELFERLIEAHPNLSRTAAVAKAIEFYLLHSPYLRYTKKEEE